MIIQQDTRACAALPVHKSDVRAAEVFQSFDSLWVSAFHQQPLITFDQRHDFNGNLRHVLANIGNIVFARFGIEQMRTRQMSLPASKRDQSALRTNIGGCEAAIMLGKKLRHEIEREIMGTNAKNCSLEFGSASIQMNIDLLACLESLHTGRQYY